MRLFSFKYLILILFWGVLISLATGCGLRYPIKGRVIDAQTEKPIEGAVIGVRWIGMKFGPPYASGSEETGRNEAVSDEDGFFFITKQPLRGYDMGVYKKGYICWTEDVVFHKGISHMIKKRKEQVDIEWGMVIALEPITEGYSIDRHACFTSSVAYSTAPRGKSIFKDKIKHESQQCIEYRRNR